MFTNVTHFPLNEKINLNSYSPQAIKNTNKSKRDLDSSGWCRTLPPTVSWQDNARCLSKSKLNRKNIRMQEWRRKKEYASYKSVSTVTSSLKQKVGVHLKKSFPVTTFLNGIISSFPYASFSLKRLILEKGAIKCKR